jgi:hypothetical protein
MNADYAVLYRNSTSFNALLNSRIAAEKPAVNSTYVDDCVQEDALLDPTTYLFHGSTSNKRKRTQSTSSPSTPEKARIKNEKAEKKKQDRIKRKKDKERKEAEGRRVKVEEDESPYYGPPSPSPPPESDRVLWREGHYLYSESERTYASRYIRFLLERDPSISNAAIALALNIKVCAIDTRPSCSTYGSSI